MLWTLSKQACFHKGDAFNFSPLSCFPFQIFKVDHSWVLLCEVAILHFSFSLLLHPSICFCVKSRFEMYLSYSPQCPWVVIIMLNSYSPVNIYCMGALGEPGTFFLYSSRDHNTQKQLGKRVYGITEYMLENIVPMIKAINKGRNRFWEIHFFLPIGKPTGGRRQFRLSWQNRTRVSGRSLKQERGT